MRDRSAVSSAGGSAPGIDLCSPLDEPARQGDRLRSITLRHGRRVVLGGSLVPEQLRELPGRLTPVVAGPIEEVDRLGVLAAGSLAE